MRHQTSHGTPVCSLEPDRDRELGSVRGWPAAGGIRNTKHRDAQALEMRAGTLAVGRISQDTAGLSSTNRNRVKVARTSVDNGLRSLCSETEAEIQPLLL